MRQLRRPTRYLFTPESCKGGVAAGAGADTSAGAGADIGFILRLCKLVAKVRRSYDEQGGAGAGADTSAGASTVARGVQAQVQT